MSRRDPVTGLTDAELARLADEAYEQRGDPRSWEDEEPPEIAHDVRSVISVRFSRGELEPIERAAAAAGVPVSTYIRNAAVNSVSAVDIDDARQRVQELLAGLEGLVSALGVEDAGRGARRRASRNRAVA